MLVSRSSSGLKQRGGAVAGIVYRNEIKAYFRYLFGYSIENEVRPLPAVIQKIENTQVNLQQELNIQNKVCEIK